ncbi:hypothetical protein FB45DRAFT_745064 [Roridomyces roridus]|uniref:MYND-type domain-containing protein n=1 Tax=Roridomyces roridus TaxID=1738132 RepID=A0AAD7FM30_9AGAR|nr:hypothetical protein FB45DRAFT_745064 [Roridomyces roridus]
MPKPNGRPCTRCGKLTSLRCSRCHEAYYCSSEHMAADWVSHKRVCRKTTHSTLKALLFPVDATTPVLVDIPYKIKIDEDGDGFVPKQYYELDSETVQRYLRGLEMKYLSRFGGRLYPHEHALAVMHGSEFRLDGSPLNQCIVNLTGGRMCIPWAGNVLVLREKGCLHSEIYEDASMADIAVMSNFFETFGP